MVFSPETTRTLESLAPDSAERTFVFGDSRPFAQCHASTLVETPDGRVLLAFFAGTHEGHRDVAIWTAERAGEESEVRDSTDDAGSGSKAKPFAAPRLAVKVAEAAHWNPVLYRLEAPEAGEIALQLKVGASIRTWTTWLARSRNGGRTFEAAAPLVPGDRGGRGAMRNKPIRLTSGDWLAVHRSKPGGVGRRSSTAARTASTVGLQPRTSRSTARGFGARA